MAPDFNLTDPRFEVNRRDFSERANKNFLHLAANQADLLLAYEVIRMGISPDGKDRAGVTPLHMTLTYMLMLVKLLVRLGFPPEVLAQVTSRLSSPGKIQIQVDRMKLQLHSLERIATLLIEQHADVNVVAYDRSILSVAVELGNWTIIELLLKHGAKRHKPTELTFSKPTDKTRYNALLKKIPVPTTRPPRLCPCHSGKPLDECHNTADHPPYPHYFICGCGRKRVYGDCCVKRGTRLVEGWHPQVSRLGAYEKTKAPTGVPEELHKYYYKALETSSKPMSPEDDKAAKAALEQNKGNFLMPFIEKLGYGDEMDPAFLHALNHTSEWFPRYASLSPFSLFVLD